MESFLCCESAGLGSALRKKSYVVERLSHHSHFLDRSCCRTGSYFQVGGALSRISTVRIRLLRLNPPITRLPCENRARIRCSGRCLLRNRLSHPRLGTRCRNKQSNVRTPMKWPHQALHRIALDVTLAVPPPSHAQPRTSMLPARRRLIQSIRPTQHATPQHEASSSQHYTWHGSVSFHRWLRQR
jgi:hypothetical protein